MDEWLGVLGCPVCRGALHQAGAYGLDCNVCGTHYPVEAGIPRLVSREDRPKLAAWSAKYQEARTNDGWLPLERDMAFALPFARPPGYTKLYWQVRRQSYRTLDRLLSEGGPPPTAGVAVDLGAGNGWLSYRLAEKGYRLIAIDINLEEPFGLAAATPYVHAGYTILPVQGDLEHPPLQPGRTSLLFLNASLHYCRELAETLRRGAEALQPGGKMIIVDTPISHQEVPGTGRGDRHLGRNELTQRLRAAGLQQSWYRVRRGPAWWIHQTKSRRRGQALFWFPIIVAIKDQNREG